MTGDEVIRKLTALTLRMAARRGRDVFELIRSQFVTSRWRLCATSGR